MGRITRFIAFSSIFLGVYAWWSTTRARSTSQHAEKVLTTCQEATLHGFDPVRPSDIYTVRELAKVYEGLLTYHYLKRPYELVPNLANAMPTVSDDGCVYTFTLQEGVKFHDNACFPGGEGRELVAQDFVYTLKRVADPKVRSPWFSMLAGKVKGLDTWRNRQIEAKQTDYTEEVAGLKAVGKYTLQLTLHRPWPQFMYMLAMNFSYVVPEEAVQYYGAEFQNHPVGTGPFMLKAFNPQLNKLVYHKNPSFREKYFPTEASEAYQHLLVDAGKRLPFVDKIITHILPEEQPRWLQFQKGKVDILDIARGNIVLNVVQEGRLAAPWKAQGIQLFLAPEQSTNFIVFNNSHPLFQHNIKLRQALSLAFDRAEHNVLFYKGAATSAQSIIPPGLDGGTQQDYVNPYSVYDLSKAKVLLAEAGYPEGQGLPTITLDVPSDTFHKQRGEHFQRCMARLGVKIRVIPHMFSELSKRIDQRKTMLHLIGWSADYPDAESFLSLLYRADQKSGAGMHFQDDAYDMLYEQATSMVPSRERTLLYEALNRMAASRVPAIYTLRQPHAILYHGWVTNYIWSDYHYGAEQYINIDLHKKQVLQGEL